MWALVFALIVAGGAVLAVLLGLGMRWPTDPTTSERGLLSILVVGPPAAWLGRGQPGRALCYPLLALPGAVVLFAAGFFIVLITGVGGCR
jgi:hypothetical protein